MNNPSRDLPRIMLQVLFIGALITVCFWVLRPFLAASLWAVMIVVATWPVMLRVQGGLWNKRGLAVAVMTVTLLLTLIVPLSFAIVTLVVNADPIMNWSKSLSTLTLPPPPAWVEGLPVMGHKLAGRWQQIALARPEELVPRLAPYVGKFLWWFVAQVGSIGMMLLHFLLTVVLAGLLYAKGEIMVDGLNRFAWRLMGARSAEVICLAGQAIRAVALGVVVTALAQSSLGGIGLAITGVPLAAVLTALMFILGVAQIGPTPVLIPSIVWLYWKGDSVQGTILLVWTVLVGSVDNFLRPVLIRRGANLPLLLIFAGVLGGLVSFGIIGLFVGPVILGVSYTLLVAWVTEHDPEIETADHPVERVD
jgi:predicted PurR-regulated permease PerM